MKLNERADEYLYSSAPPIKSPKQRAISPIELSLLDCPRPWYTVICYWIPYNDVYSMSRK